MLNNQGGFTLFLINRVLALPKSLLGNPDTIQFIGSHSTKCCKILKSESLLNRWKISLPSSQKEVCPGMLLLLLVAKSRLTLCNPMDCSQSGSSAHGVYQARILEWVAISFSRDLPNPWIEPESPALADGFFTTEPQGKPMSRHM